jgi:hypothetical protein
LHVSTAEESHTQKSAHLHGLKILEKRVLQAEAILSLWYDPETLHEQSSEALHISNAAKGSLQIPAKRHLETSPQEMPVQKT